MKRHLLAMIAGIGLCVPSAHATSEFFFQTPAGEQEVEFQFDYEMQTMNLSDSGTSNFGRKASEESTTTRLGIKYGYGFSEKFAFDFVLGYKTGTSDLSVPTSASSETKDTISGLEDLQFAALGTYKLETMNLHWKADLFYSMSNRESKTTKSGPPEESDITPNSGGMTLDVMVGFDTEMSGATVGAALETGVYHTHAKTDSIDINGTTTEVESNGGNTLKLSFFYERGDENYLWGAAFDYFDKTEVDLKYNNSVVGSENKIKKLGLEGYSRYHMGPGHLLASLRYDMYRPIDGRYYNLEDGNGIVLGLGYRMHF